MQKRRKLSVIAVFHNNRDYIESTLGAIYNLQDTDFELFIINDGSDDDSADIIHSLLDYYQHDETYYFEHADKLGRGRSINEAIDNISGNYVWVVDALETVNEDALQDAMAGLDEYQSLCAIQDPFFDNFEVINWIPGIRNGQIPGDQLFLWNWKLCDATGQFFNPFIDKFNGFELASRLLHQNNFNEIVPFFTSLESEPGDVQLKEINELLFSLTRRAVSEGSSLRDILEQINEINSISSHLTSEEGLLSLVNKHNFNSLLKEAGLLHREGSNSESLEIVNRLLEFDPDHIEVQRLKASLLERMKRYVEAAEIKQQLKIREKQTRQVNEDVSNGSGTDQPETQSVAEKYDEPVQVSASIIIPTASDRKPVLEECLVALGEYCSPDETELIIIDNASLDDTCDYLQQLENDHFLNCKVITNHHNMGFGQSVNVGLEVARGNYICVMHNDAIVTSDAIQKMRQILEEHPEYGILGPRTANTLNPEQNLASAVGGAQVDIVPADYVDSFCMVFRKELGLRFDEHYELAFLDDIDFCSQALAAGWKIGIAPHVIVEHHYGITTTDLGLEAEDRRYWKNVDYFNKKWNIRVEFPTDQLENDVVDRFVMLNAIMNPFFPEPHFRQLFEDWFTSEAKTVILENKWDQEELTALVQLMGKMEQRDVMRQLEEELDNYDLDTELLYELASFYYEHNIYSRSRHYISEINQDDLPFRFKLILLKITIGEKDLEQAIPLLNELLSIIPSHPELYKLSGDLHAMEGNPKEAQRFYEIATQLDPFRYPVESENYQYED